MKMATYKRAAIAGTSYSNPYKARCDNKSLNCIGIITVIAITCIAAGIAICYLTSLKQIITFL